MIHDREKVIALVQLPPPVHGVTEMNQKAISVLGELFDVRVINISSAASLNDVGRLRITKILNVLRLCFLIVLELVQFKPNIAYFSLCPLGKAFYRDFIIALILKLFKVKVVIHLHNNGMLDANKIRKRLYRHVFKKCFVIHLSSIFWKELKPFMPPNRFYVVPNCCPGPLPGASVKANLDKSNKTVQILFLSNYIEGKGPHYVLDLAEKLASSKARCRIRMAGDWKSPRIKAHIDNWKAKHADLIGSGFIEISGAVYGREKIELLSRSDIMVFPSYIDTFPLVLLEAKAAGLAIISTDMGAIPEILDFGKTGFICDKHSTSQLFQYTIELLENPDKLRNLQLLSLESYRSKYTEDAFKANFTRAFQRIESSASG